MFKSIEHREKQNMFRAAHYKVYIYKATGTIREEWSGIWCL